MLAAVAWRPAAAAAAEGQVAIVTLISIARTSVELAPRHLHPLGRWIPAGWWRWRGHQEGRRPSGRGRGRGRGRGIGISVHCTREQQ